MTTTRTFRAPPEEEARLRAVAEYGIIGVPAPPDLQVAAELAAHVCGVAQAAVHILDDHLQHPIVTVGTDPKVCARGDSMCAISIAESDPVTVPDARSDTRFAGNPWVTGGLGRVRFYAAAQLRAPGGHAIGTLCVFDEHPRGLAPEQRGALDRLGRLVIDILELHRRDRLLRHALDSVERTGAELTRSNNALRHFAAQVSHDLRNPLTGVLGFASYLAELPAVAGDPEAQYAAQRAISSATRMWQMIEDVLKHAAAGGQPNRRPVAVGEIVAHVLEDLGTALRESGARVTVGDLPTVHADATQLRVLLQNLVGNAVKFRRADRPAVIAITGCESADRWRLAVADNGVGIPSEHRARVREMFARLHPEIDGSGVGLATCERVAAAHGGDLSIAETPGGGTTVRISLPRPTA
ncbi:MAG TPA: ATP-binding protein [Pilimelia sp.]|nr:ATP-binding protein [Pilimelia sp.]